MYDRRQDTFVNPANMPLDGDTIIDLDGREYEFRNELPHTVGIYLKGHPTARGFQSWWEFARWYNEK